jgi:hypothetical protein
MTQSFVTSTYQGNTQTGAAAGDLVEVQTSAGTVVLRSCSNGDTCIDLPGIRFSTGDGQIILES